MGRSLATARISVPISLRTISIGRPDRNRSLRRAASDQARAQTIADFKTNRYDGATGTLTFSAAQAEAFKQLQAHYQDFFAQPTTKFGLRPDAITDPQQIRQLTAFFSWSAWAGSALRPG